MRACFAARLPDELAVATDGLKPHSLAINGFDEVLMWPPHQCTWPAPTNTMDDALMDSVRDALMGRRQEGPDEFVRIDDAPAVLGSAIRIDFRRKQFNRTRHEPREPDPQFGIQLINTFLSRLRSLSQADWITPLKARHTTWALEFSNDDGSDLPPDPRLIRRETNIGGTTRMFGLSKRRWDALATFEPDFEPLVWDELLLDAQALMPKLGPALVLAHSAIETFAEQLCTRLAGTASIPTALWSWITDRGDYRKEPSTGEFLDTLLYVTAGRSLKKDSPDLWTAYARLREVRNSYVHTGRVSDKKGRLLTREQAQELIRHAKDIVTWLETLAPSDLRRTIETHTTVDLPLRFR